MAKALAEVYRLPAPASLREAVTSLFRATDLYIGARLLYAGTSYDDEPVFVVTAILRQSKVRWTRRPGTSVETAQDRVEVACGEDRRQLGALYVAENARWQLLDS